MVSEYDVHGEGKVVERWAFYWADWGFVFHKHKERSKYESVSFFFFHSARNDLNLSSLFLPIGSFALCCLVIMGALHCLWGKWFHLNNLPHGNQRGQVFNMENALTSENQKADSLWNDSLSLNHRVFIDEELQLNHASWYSRFWLS